MFCYQCSTDLVMPILLSQPMLRRLQVLETLRSSPRQWYLVALWPLTTQEREFRALKYTKHCAVSQLLWHRPFTWHRWFAAHPADHLLGDAGSSSNIMGQSTPDAACPHCISGQAGIMPPDTCVQGTV